MTHLEEAAARIPCMGAKKIGAHLRQAASEIPAGSCIVEFGAWLGAGTAQLALAASQTSPTPEIHSFDVFEAAPGHVPKAAASGIVLVEGQDTLPLVTENLSAFDTPIHLYKGDVADVTWRHGDIGLFVDDASKEMPVFSEALRTFGPSWIPGETIIIMMDYWYWTKFSHDPDQAARLRVQHDFVLSHPEHFEIVNERPVKSYSTAIVRYKKAFDFSTVPREYEDFVA